MLILDCRRKLACSLYRRRSSTTRGWQPSWFQTHIVIIVSFVSFLSSFPQAVKYYEGLANELTSRGHALDVFMCSLEQVRLFDLRECHLAGVM